MVRRGQCDFKYVCLRTSWSWVACNRVQRSPFLIWPLYLLLVQSYAFHLSCKSWELGFWGFCGFGFLLLFVFWLFGFFKGKEISTKMHIFVYLFPLCGKNSGGPAGLYPMRSKETRFGVKIAGICGQAVHSLLIAAYHDFQLSHLVGRRQVLFNSSSTMCWTPYSIFSTSWPRTKVKIFGMSEKVNKVMHSLLLPVTSLRCETAILFVSHLTVWWQQRDISATSRFPCFCPTALACLAEFSTLLPDEEVVSRDQTWPTLCHSPSWCCLDIFVKALVICPVSHVDLL